LGIKPLGRRRVMAGEMSPARTLDCVGLYCPEPLFQTRESIDTIAVGEILEVYADDPAAEEDLTRFAKRAGHEVVAVEKVDDQLHMLIRRQK
jgi:tRNA 2-thiouridine synthesizing protein A